MKIVTFELYCSISITCSRRSLKTSTSWKVSMCSSGEPPAVKTRDLAPLFDKNRIFGTRFITHLYCGVVVSRILRERDDS